jgi:predicted RNase H-like HicB family nuclease
MKVKVILESQPEGGYTVYCPAFPGCISEGETKREALENFLDALEAWLEVKTERMMNRSRQRRQREVVEVKI